MINLKSRNAVIIISILWGIGLSCLFKKVCVGRQCIEYRAPPSDYIKKNTFRYNDKCYKYTPKVVECKGNDVIYSNENFHSRVSKYI